MSVNITSASYVGGSLSALSIRASALVDLALELQEERTQRRAGRRPASEYAGSTSRFHPECELPEANFVEALLGNAQRLVEGGQGHLLLTVEATDLWTGEWSGVTEEAGTLARCLERTFGRADIVLYWESGPPTGYRVADGAVTRHEVLVQLGAQLPEGA